MKKSKVLVLDDVLPDLQHKLLYRGLDVYTGGLEVTLSWVQTGLDAPAAIIAEMDSQEEAQVFIEQIRAKNYQGPICLVLGEDILDLVALASSPASRHTWLFSKSHDVDIIAITVTYAVMRLFKTRSNPALLPISDN